MEGPDCKVARVNKEDLNTTLRCPQDLPGIRKGHVGHSWCDFLGRLCTCMLAIPRQQAAALRKISMASPFNVG